ncbi:MAG TPA: CBS domain-containing protein [Archaeoglobaceae archaeon]|nr:CBS domain-containing protein [Archaeoglobaceae archaeon]
MPLKVSDYMTRNVITLSSENTVDDAINLIRKTGHDGFPVVDSDNRIIGYVSARDLLTRDADAKIGDVMVRAIYVAREYMDLKDAARVMFRTGHSKMPVVDENEKIVGIITNSDVIRSQIERADPEKVDKLRRTIEKIHKVKIEVSKGVVEVKRLIPTQTKVYADELKGRVYELKRGLAEPIVVIKKDSRIYLVDGHHRVIAARRMGIKNLDAYILNVPGEVELGIERLVRKRGLKSIDSIEVIEDVHHPLVEITLKNKK